MWCLVKSQSRRAEFDVSYVNRCSRILPGNESERERIWQRQCVHMNLANTVGKRGRSGACVSGNQSGIS